MKSISASRKPGVQKPSKYSSTGPNYAKYGEQPGFIYVPQYDTYFVDPKAIKEQYKKEGLIAEDPAPPKQPSAFSQLAPIAGAGLALAGGKAIGEKLPAYLDKGTDYIGGLLGLGGSASGGATAAQSALAAAPAQYGGLFSQTALPVSGAGSLIDPAIASGAAGSGASGGLFSLGGIGAQGNAILPAAGALGLYDLIANKRKGGRGVLQGAASGAAIGSGFGMPLVGAGVGGLLGLAGGLFGKHGESKLEDKKREQLAEQGITLGPKDWEANQTFAQSRNESDLTGSDILNAADWYIKFGPRWQNTSDERKLEIANEALKRKLVREHNGGLSIDTSGLQDFINQG